VIKIDGPRDAEPPSAEAAHGLSDDEILAPRDLLSKNPPQCRHRQQKQGAYQVDSSFKFLKT
jgi:hypothetical protein